MVSYPSGAMLELGTLRGSTEDGLSGNDVGLVPLAFVSVDHDLEDFECHLWVFS